MSGWIAVGKRYLNLDNVSEVLVDDHQRVARVFFVGGGTVELRDDDARDLQTLLDRHAADLAETHRTIFAMPDA